MDEYPNKKKRSRSTQLELLSQNVNQTTGKKYRKEASTFLGSSFSVEYCNFITAEQDEKIEALNEVEKNKEAEYLAELVDVVGTEDDIDTEEDDIECDVNEGSKDQKYLLVK